MAEWNVDMGQLVKSAVVNVPEGSYNGDYVWGGSDTNGGVATYYKDGGRDAPYIHFTVPKKQRNENFFTFHVTHPVGGFNTNIWCSGDRRRVLEFHFLRLEVPSMPDKEQKEFRAFWNKGANQKAISDAARDFWAALFDSVRV